MSCMLSVEDIIELCIKNLEIKLDDSTRAKALKFLDRQIKANPVFKFGMVELSDRLRYSHGRKNYPEILANRLGMFLCQTGEIDIPLDLNGESIRIGRLDDGTPKERKKRKKDLYALSQKAVVKSATIRDKRTKTARELLFDNIYKWGGCWSEYVDEVGKDSETTRYFGKAITHKDANKCEEPAAGKLYEAKPSKQTKREKEQKAKSKETKSKSKKSKQRKPAEAKTVEQTIVEEEHAPEQKEIIPEPKESKTEPEETIPEPQSPCQGEQPAKPNREVQKPTIDRKGQYVLLIGIKPDSKKVRVHKEKPEEPLSYRALERLGQGRLFEPPEPGEIMRLTHYVDRKASDGVKELVYFYTKGEDHEKFYDSTPKTAFSWKLAEIEEMKNIRKVQNNYIKRHEKVYKFGDGRVWIANKFDPEKDPHRRCICDAVIDAEHDSPKVGTTEERKSI